MSFVSTKRMLLEARRAGYAVGAFNVENMEMIQAVIAAAAEAHAPVIIQTTPGSVKYGGTDLFFANVAALARKSDVPVAIHLDHGDSFDLAVQAIRSGYTSIMIDGSNLPFEENIALTSRTVGIAKPVGIPVEGELGSVGGKEDGLVGKGGNYTDPAQAAEFVSRTGITSLAVAIGTAHGVYSEKPRLDFGRLREIRKAVDIPLVLHGASGLPDEDVQKCISEGICKVNFCTELRFAYSDGVKEVLSAKPGTYDPKKYGASGRERVKQVVLEKIKLCGCDGKW